MAKKKGIPEKKTLSDYLIYIVIAVLLLIAGMWVGYVLQETANLKGEADYAKAINKAEEYMTAESLLSAVVSAVTENGMAQSGAMYGGMAGLLIVVYQMSKAQKRFHRKGEEHGSARWGTDKEKAIVSDTNDFYNNAILADDVLLVVDRKKRDYNALSDKDKRVKEQREKREAQQNERRLCQLKKEIENFQKFPTGE